MKTALGFAYKGVRHVLSGSVTLVFQVFGSCGVYMNYALVLGMHGAGFWRLPNAQDGQSPGPVFLRLSLHWQKSDNGFYFTHIQICNKMPNSCQNCPNQPFCSCCFSESRDSPAVSLLSSTCLIPPPHGSLLTMGGYSRQRPH